MPRGLLLSFPSFPFCVCVFVWLCRREGRKAQGEREREEIKEGEREKGGSR